MRWFVLCVLLVATAAHASPASPKVTHLDIELVPNDSQRLRVAHVSLVTVGSEATLLEVTLIDGLGAGRFVTAPTQTFITGLDIALMPGTVTASIVALDGAGHRSAPTVLTTVTSKEYRCGLGAFFGFVVFAACTIVVLMSLVLVVTIRRGSRYQPVSGPVSPLLAEYVGRTEQRYAGRTLGVTLAAIAAAAALGLVMAAYIGSLVVLVPLFRLNDAQKVLRALDNDGALATLAKTVLIVRSNGREVRLATTPHVIEQAHRNSVPTSTAL